MTETEVLIAGGGIIGLSLALELALAGRRVTVLERQQVMREASWAAAGMLAAHDPENPAALKPLSELSLSLYPEYLRRIEDLSGKAVPLRTTHTLQFLHGGERTWLDEHSLDPRDLCAALPIAARAAGVTIIEHTTVHAVRDAAHIETDAGLYSALQFVNCCGAWAADLAALPVVPCKGQMLLARLVAGMALDHVIRTPELYLVPRGDGRVVVGATVERAGFDKKTIQAALERLADRATARWPGLSGCTVLDSWVGLRPESSDGLPILGHLEGHCWAATGHYRNGILLAPSTAHLMGQLLAGAATSIPLDAFRCERFTPPNVHELRAG